MSFHAFAEAVNAIAAHAAASTRIHAPHPAHHAPSSTPAAAMSAFCQRTSASTVSAENTLIECFVPSDDFLLGKSSTRGVGRCVAHRLPPLAVHENRARGLRHRVDIAHGTQRAGHAILD